MNLKEFGLWFAELREKSGYRSQRSLALASGISNSTFARIEAGNHQAEPDTLKKVAPYLKDVTYEELMEAAGYLDEVASENASNKIASAISDDPELVEFWNELTKRDDLQLLFKQVKDLSPDTVKRIVKYIKMVEDEEAEEN